MFKATENICHVFDENDVKYITHEDEDSSVVVASVASERTKFHILFISEDDDNDVAMRVFDFISFKEKRKKSMNVLKLANQLNDDFRYLKFSVDKKDSTVTLSYDFPISCKNPGETALEMLLRLYQEADNLYTMFVKALQS